MITTAEREELDKAFTTLAPGKPARGRPMANTLSGWKYLAGLYSDTIVDQKQEISSLKRKINKLEQRR